MDSTIIYIIIGIAALIAGVLAGKVIFAKNTDKQIQEAELESKKLIAEAQLKADSYKKEREIEAKERFAQMKIDSEKDIMLRTQKIVEGENKIKQKEQSLNQKETNVDKQVKDNEVIKDNLNKQIEIVNVKRTELEKHQEEHIRRLEKVAGLSAEDAKTQLIEGLKQEAHSQALVLQQEIIEDAKLKANKEARKIVIQTIQRTAAEQAIENSITVFNLESDEIKGSIIGREGRNIRAIEAATGVEDRKSVV